MAAKLKYGGTSMEEQEVVIRLDATSQTAHIWSAWPRYSRRLEAKYGTPGKTTWQGEWVTGAWWTVPIKQISLRSLPASGRSTRLAPQGRPVRPVGSAGRGYGTPR